MLDLQQDVAATAQPMASPSVTGGLDAAGWMATVAGGGRARAKTRRTRNSRRLQDTEAHREAGRMIAFEVDHAD
jgi:hypothetical protein